MSLLPLEALPPTQSSGTALVAEAHRSDLKMVAWTVNDPERMKAMIAAGVDGIITDYPNVLADLIANR